MLKDEFDKLDEFKDGLGKLDALKDELDELLIWWMIWIRWMN